MSLKDKIIERLNESKVGDEQWHEKVLKGAANDGIKFKMKKTIGGANNERTYHVEADDEKHEAKMHNHLKSWLDHKGTVKRIGSDEKFHKYQTYDGFKVHLRKTEKGDEQRKNDENSQEHSNWRDKHKADVESGEYRKRIHLNK